MLSISLCGQIIFTVLVLLGYTTSPVFSRERAACAPVENTPSFTIAYGQVLVDGVPAPAGSIVEARSPRDERVGCFEIAEDGYYGAMYIYGEDNSVIPIIPGMREGEAISFQVDGAATSVTPALTWQNDRQLHQAVLSAVALPPAVINDLTVAKEGDDLILRWSAVDRNEQGRPLTVNHYKVYRHTDPYFQPASPDLLGTTNITSFTELGALVDPANYYYLVTSVSSAGKESGLSNREGKFGIEVVAGWNLLAWPLLPAETSLDGVLGRQLYGTSSPSTADRVLVWNGDSQTYQSAWFCGGPICESWGEPWANHWLAGDYAQSTLTLEPDTGFWIQNRSGASETLVLVGGVAESGRTITVGQSWQMLGSTFPISRTLDSANIPATGTDSPSTADRILSWDAGTRSYSSAWYCGGPVCESWGEPWANHWLAGDYAQTDIVLEPGLGIWYQNRHDTFVWPNPVVTGQN